MTRRATEEDLQAMIWQAEIVSTEQSGAGEITTTIDDESGRVEVEAETWGQAGLVSRVQDGGATGYAKALRIQLGESVLVISSYDPRNHVACEPGEVILHALANEGDSGARALIRLKSDGTVQVEGERTEMHGSSDAPALASVVHDLLEVFCNTLPVAQDGGAAIQTAVKTKWQGVAPTGFNKVCASSKVKLGG